MEVRDRLGVVATGAGEIAERAESEADAPGVAPGPVLGEPCFEQLARPFRFTALGRGDPEIDQGEGREVSPRDLGRARAPPRRRRRRGRSPPG